MLPQKAAVRLLEAEQATRNTHRVTDTVSHSRHRCSVPTHTRPPATTGIPIGCTAQAGDPFDIAGLGGSSIGRSGDRFPNRPVRSVLRHRGVVAVRTAGPLRPISRLLGTQEGIWPRKTARSEGMSSWGSFHRVDGVGCDSLRHRTVAVMVANLAIAMPQSKYSSRGSNLGTTTMSTFMRPMARWLAYRPDQHTQPRLKRRPKGTSEDARQNMVDGTRACHNDRGAAPQGFASSTRPHFLT